MATEDEVVDMTPDLDSGLLWVENRIRELAQELGRPVDCMEWPQPCQGKEDTPETLAGRGVPDNQVSTEGAAGGGGDAEIQRRLVERIRERLIEVAGSRTQRARLRYE